MNAILSPTSRGSGGPLVGHPTALMVVSCRHCFQPVSVVRTIDENERVALRDHLGGCTLRDLSDGDLADARADGLLWHFRIVPMV